MSKDNSVLIDSRECKLVDFAAKFSTALLGESFTTPVHHAVTVATGNIAQVKKLCKVRRLCK